MYERLTKRTENGGVQFSNGEYWNTVYPQNENCLTDIHRMAIRLCDLEDKIEQGKILELPCAVGSEAYHLTSADTLDERIKQAKKKRNEAYRKDSVQGIVYWDGYLDALKAVKEGKENETTV